MCVCTCITTGVHQISPPAAIASFCLTFIYLVSYFCLSSHYGWLIFCVLLACSKESLAQRNWAMVLKSNRSTESAFPEIVTWWTAWPLHAKWILPSVLGALVALFYLSLTIIYLTEQHVCIFLPVLHPGIFIMLYPETTIIAFLVVHCWLSCSCGDKWPPNQNVFISIWMTGTPSPWTGRSKLLWCHEGNQYNLHWYGY